MKRVVLIDGKNQLYRMGAANVNLARGDGFPTGALFGCLNSTIALAKHLPKTSFVWVWDGDGETWRHRFTANEVLIKDSFLEHYKYKARPIKHEKKYGYKANRERKEDVGESKYPTDMYARALLQVPVLRLILERSGFRSFQIPQLEGDDLIAILTRYLLRHTHAEVIIHSGDKDFIQLLKHERVKILLRIQDGKPLYMDRRKVRKKFGISVRDWVKFRAWTGDPTDNIKHLRDVGEKVALRMIDAGLDPSLKIDRIPEEAKREFARFFEPYGVERMWPFVESNYKLCKLVSRRDDKRMFPKTREAVEQLLEDIEFTRDKTKLTAETYRRISFVLMQYQLKSILSKRDVLWRIP